MSASCTICEKEVDAFKKCFICSSKKICMSCYARFNKCSECFARIEIENQQYIQQEKDRKKRSQDAISTESDDAAVNTLKTKKQKEDQVAAESSNARIEIQTEATGTATGDHAESAAGVVSSATAESSTTAEDEAAAAAVSAVSESASSLTSGDEAAAAAKLAPPSTSRTAGDEAAVTSSSLGRQEQQHEEGLLHSKNRQSTLAIESPGNK